MPSRDDDEARTREARAALDRLTAEGDGLGSHFTRAADRAARHFAGREADADGTAPDAAEVWGRRIGRALSLVFFVVLVVWIVRDFM